MLSLLFYFILFCVFDPPFFLYRLFFSASLFPVFLLGPTVSSRLQICALSLLFLICLSLPEDIDAGVDLFHNHFFPEFLL